MSPDAETGLGESPGQSRSNILVTGAAGFIGSHLCERLLEEGYRVWALDNFDGYYDPGRKLSNLTAVLREPSIHLVEGDIRDEILLDGLMSDVSFDAVVHLAERPDTNGPIESAELYYDVNVTGTLHVLEAMRHHSVPLMLFGSSDSVYGADSDSPATEDLPADRPTSIYAASKRSAELLCHTHHHLYGLSVYCLRFSSVYGPRQRPDMPIYRLAQLLSAGEPIPLYADGNSQRSFTYVDDAVQGVLLSLKSARSRNGAEPVYEIINVGARDSIRLSQLVSELADRLHVSPVVTERSAQQVQDGPSSVPSVERSAKLLGYEPSVTLPEGLDRFAAWYLDVHSERDPAPLSSDGQPEGSSA